jgi:N-formylglutamate amidohydrolase
MRANKGELWQMNDLIPSWDVIEAEGPIIATAIHHGHTLRPEVALYMGLDATQRLREEDPYTEHWTHIGDTRLVVHRSRFEMDLNRPRERAVYLKEKDAWGLRVWKESPPTALIRRSLEQYDEFYCMLHGLLERKRKCYSHFVVLDLHTYNHRRQGPFEPEDDPYLNPEINLGTEHVDHLYWSNLIHRFIADLRQHEFMGRHLDVRENVKFGGGWMNQWINKTFPKVGCVLSIEVKKTFMDEWSGKLYLDLFAAYHRALVATLAGIRESLSVSCKAG